MKKKSNHTSAPTGRTRPQKKLTRGERPKASSPHLPEELGERKSEERHALKEPPSILSVLLLDPRTSISTISLLRGRHVYSAHVSDTRSIRWGHRISLIIVRSLPRSDSGEQYRKSLFRLPVERSARGLFAQTGEEPKEDSRLSFELRYLSDFCACALVLLSRCLLFLGVPCQRTVTRTIPSPEKRMKSSLVGCPWSWASRSTHPLSVQLKEQEKLLHLPSPGRLRAPQGFHRLLAALVVSG